MSEFRKLAKDIYVFLQPPLIWYSSAGVIIGDRDVIVIDSLTNAGMTQKLRAEIHRVTDRPIRFLVPLCGVALRSNRIVGGPRG